MVFWLPQDVRSILHCVCLTYHHIFPELQWSFEDKSAAYKGIHVLVIGEDSSTCLTGSEMCIECFLFKRGEISCVECSQVFLPLRTRHKVIHWSAFLLPGTSCSCSKRW